MEYDNLSLAELKNIAKERQLKGWSAMKKQELAQFLADNEKPAAPENTVVQETPVVREEPEKPAVQNSPSVAEPAAKENGSRPVTRVEVKRQPTGQVSGIVPEGYESQNRGQYQRPMQNNQNVRPNYNQQGQRQQYNQNGRPNYSQQGQRQQYNQNNRPGYNQQSDNRPSYNQQSDNRPSYNQQSDNRQEYRQPSDAVAGRIVSTAKITAEEREALDPTISPEIDQLDSGETKTGILELVEGYGFIRCDNFLPGENDVYVAPAQIRKFNLKTGDIVTGNTKVRSATEKFSALLYIKTINGVHPSEAVKRPKFEDLTPIFPNYRLHLETPGCTPAMRIVDLLSPIGKGQRGMIVSQPKAGKTTLLKQIASALTKNYPDLHLIILLIDERPEEVTDMKESIQGPNVEVIYSTFDELPENHKRVSEMVIERAKRLVEHKKDVVILLDSITRLARAYNLTVTASGRTLSGGLDPAALHMPKKFFGAARCMREGGSLTVLATALVETGSRMDDVVFEEFKGTGNMELVLDRNLSERRIFPAIDLPKSSTRREDLLLSPEEIEANNIIRRAFNSAKPEEAAERIINMFSHTKTNAEFIEVVKKTKLY